MALYGARAPGKGQGEGTHVDGLVDEAEIVLMVANWAPVGRCRGTALCGCRGPGIGLIRPSFSGICDNISRPLGMDTKF